MGGGVALLAGAALGAPAGASAAPAAPAAAVSASMVETLIPLAPAPAVSTDFWWTPWLKCPYTRHKIGYQSEVRWRFDWYHDASGKRVSKVVTYADVRGPAAIKPAVMTVEELKGGKTPRRISIVTYTLNTSTADKYVEGHMKRIAMSVGSSAKTTLTLPPSDAGGGTCNRSRAMQ